MKWAPEALLFWVVIAGATKFISCAASVPQLIVVEDDHPHKLGYKVIKFTMDYDTTQEDYSNFIKELRDALTSGEQQPPQGIRRLRDPDELPISSPQRFVLVQLTNSREETVTLALDAVNAYLVAWEARGTAYFLSDAPSGAQSNLFSEAGDNRHTLKMDGTYPTLESNNFGGIDRRDLNLGSEELQSGIGRLVYTNLNPDNRRQLARALLVVIQMVIEAARFFTIEQEVRSQLIHNPDGFRPSAYMIELENSWGRISRVVQSSPDCGTFGENAITLNLDGTLTNLQSSSQVAAIIALMLFFCNKGGKNELPMLITPVVPVFNPRGDYNYAYDDRFRNRDDDVCPIVEPVVSIVGRNGLCIDVRDGRLVDYQPVQLWPCRDGSANQLWKIKADRTIRTTNNKCLYTTGYSVESSVAILDCPTAGSAASGWVIWGNGTIINPHSGLVLSADFGSKGTTLTLASNTYASRQGWFPCRDTLPLVMSIVGLGGLCLQANFGAGVWLEKCNRNWKEQRWEFMGDGTIRPKDRQDQCLIAPTYQTPSTNITVDSCRTGSPGQRWMFTNDGSITNLNSGMVVDVKESNTDLRQLVIRGFNGNRNQMWRAVP